jgi:hypothetical protein
MSILSGATGLALLALSSSPARGDLTWDFSYSGYSDYYGTMDASGTLRTTDTAVPLPGTGLTGYAIIGITGQRDGVNITGLVNNGNFPGNTLSWVLGAQWDNALVTTGSPQLDYYGLEYTTVGGKSYGVSANAFPNGGGYSEYSNPDWHTGQLSSFSITAVPESSTLIAGAGALGLLLLGAGVHSKRAVKRIGKDA